MSNIVVCKKFRLIEISKGKFKNNDMKKELRSSVKITKEDMERFNAVHGSTGIIYEIDEKATAERNAPKLDRTALIEEAKSMGLEFAKNIKTEALINLIEENK